MTWSDDFSFFLSGIDEACFQSNTTAGRVAEYLRIHTPGNFPDLEGIRLAILGVCESRRSAIASIANGPNRIREKLYSLYFHGKSAHVADLGNIVAGENPTDTDQAVKTTVKHLLDKQIAVIIIGGSQELTLANYSAYEIIDATVNVALVDAIIDLGEFRDPLSPDNFLSAIVLHDQSFLFNLSILGYQTYLNNPATLSMMEKLFFDTRRLGTLASNIKLTEPIFRNADVISFDVNAIRNEAAPGTSQPNGFSGEQACQMARYAGASDKSTSIGFYNYDPDRDERGQTAMLIAQMIWYAIEGFSNSLKESPLLNHSNFTQYKVHMPDGKDEMLFYKSKRTDKWWMNVPYSKRTAPEKMRNHIVPCDYSDYENACRGEVPDTWWKTYQKLA